MITGNNQLIKFLTQQHWGDGGRERLTPLSDAAMEIKLTAANARLLFEELMAGGASENVEVMWACSAREKSRQKTGIPVRLKRIHNGKGEIS